MQNVSNAGHEITYEVRIRGERTNDLVEKLRAVDGIETVNIVTYTGEVLG